MSAAPKIHFYMPDGKDAVCEVLGKNVRLGADALKTWIQRDVTCRTCRAKCTPQLANRIWNARQLVIPGT